MAEAVGLLRLDLLAAGEYVSLGVEVSELADEGELGPTYYANACQDCRNDGCLERS